MLSAVKHPHRTEFLACARNDKKKALGMTPPCHAEQSVSEVKHPYWIPRFARNDKKDSTQNDKRQVRSSAAKPAPSFGNTTQAIPVHGAMPEKHNRPKK